MERFCDLLRDFIAEEYGRALSDIEVSPESALEDTGLDEAGKANLPAFIAEAIHAPLGEEVDTLFLGVKSVDDLYQKLRLLFPSFALFAGEEDSENSFEEKVLDSGALAKLLEAEDDEELIEEQLALIKPVQIAARTHVPGKCIECEERMAVLDCNQCGDELCKICYRALHRKGNRTAHTVTPKPGVEQLDLDAPDVEAPEDTASGGILSSIFGSAPSTAAAAEIDFAFKAQFIPVRLSLKERQLLRLCQAQLSVSTYTDAIDKPGLKQNKRVHAQLLKICAFLSGLAASVDYEVGQKVLKQRNWKEYEGFFTKVLELARRYKVLNPDRMRTDYGRLMYLMMDASRNEVEQLLGFSIRKPVITVATYLEKRGASALLNDPLMEIATRAIDQMSEDEGKKSRQEIRQEVKEKERAVKTLARRYCNKNIKEDDIKWCLYSIGDNRTFLLQHRDPVQRMIKYLKRYFGPDAPQLPDEFSLAIYGGTDGSRLTHSHEKQYLYVLQSLTLWREILNDMFQLWVLAEEDMVDPAYPYKLEDTGQGLQRVQQSPRVAKAMRDLLYRTQNQLGSSEWVGSSVVHLGDKNVPNALVFLDKYTQVSRILNPICICLDRLPEMCQDEKTAHFIDTVFGGVEKARITILADFYRSAFDGGGADNFYDAGSCVDGRLTSAWHWCNSLPQKHFFSIFKLSGFTSFDGEFEE